MPPAAFQTSAAAAMLAGLPFIWYDAIERLRTGAGIDALSWGCLPSRIRRRCISGWSSDGRAARHAHGYWRRRTRDLLLSRVPVVFQSDIYALAALAGALVVVLGDWLHWPAMPTAIGAILLCFSLRILAMWFHWHLPSSHHESRPHND